MNRLMFVYLSGPEKGKTRIYTQDHVTLGTAESCDLKLVPEEGGHLPDGAIADVYYDDGSYRFVPRVPTDSLGITINGVLVPDEGGAGHQLHDGDTLHIGHGLSSASVLFQVLPANFAATHLVKQEREVERPASEVHPLTATLFVKELSASLWAEIPRKAKVIGVVSIVFLVSLVLASAIYSFIATHRNTTENERLREQFAAEASRRQQEQDIIRTQQAEIERLREASEQTRLFAQNIAGVYNPAVCLIVGSYSFAERGTGRVLRYESADNANEPPVDENGNLLASVNGSGPAVQIEWTGTGFVIEEGLIVTNKHVVQPAAGDPLAQIIMRQGPGFTPRFDTLVAFFPSIKTPFALKAAQVSDRYDLALCSFVQGNAALPVLPLSTGDLSSVIGESVVLLGYPTGVDGLLQRIEESERREILTEHGRSAEDVAGGLAERGLIRPLTTTGIVSDALPARLAHTAHTTEGGSGGPIFDRDGRVIAVNQAILTPVDGGPSFGGSNFGVPIKAVTDLLAARKNGN